MGKVASNFSTSTSYAVGDLCLYSGLLYMFTSSHTGAWNSSHVIPVDDNIELNLTRVVAGKNNAVSASDYADTVVFAPSLMSGTRYKYVLTNAPDPR